MLGMTKIIHHVTEFLEYEFHLDHLDILDHLA